MIKSRPGASSKIKKWLAEHGEKKSAADKTEKNKHGAEATQGAPNKKKEGK